MCFRTTEHKAAACPKVVKCFLCSRAHHFNNHSRIEIDDYYKRNQNKSIRRKWLNDAEASNTHHQSSITKRDGELMNHEYIPETDNDLTTTHPQHHIFYHQHDLYPSKPNCTHPNKRDLDTFTTLNRKPFLFGLETTIDNQEINILLTPDQQ